MKYLNKLDILLFNSYLFLRIFPRDHYGERIGGGLAAIFYDMLFCVCCDLFIGEFLFELTYTKVFIFKLFTCFIIPICIIVYLLLDRTETLYKKLDEIKSPFIRIASVINVLLFLFMFFYICHRCDWLRQYIDYPIFEF